MRRARFVTIARREFLERVAYYSEARSGLGEQFAVELEHTVARALAFPESGSPSTDDTRRVWLKDFPVSVVYKIEDDNIVIFAVAHDAQRPDYWLSRLEP